MAQHGLSNLFNFGRALNIKLASQPDQKLSNWMTAHYVATFRTSTFYEGTSVYHFCNHTCLVGVDVFVFVKGYHVFPE